MTAQAILATINEHKNILKQFGVVRLGLFGSAASETASFHDIDLLVEFNPTKKTYRNFYNTATLLENALQKPVDLLTKEAVSPYLKPYIEKNIQYVQISN